MAKQTTDIIAQFPGIAIIHQKIPAHEVGRHSHDEHEFFLPLQGEISVRYENKTVKAGPGRMLYVPPELDHSFSSTSQGSGERLIWIIDQKLWNKHSSEKFEATSLAGNSMAKEILFYLLVHQKIEGAKYFVSALVESLLESIKAEQMNTSSLFIDHLGGKVTDARIRSSLRFLDEKMAEVSIPKVAKESGLSQRNFSRLFAQETGLSPKNYLILRRVEKAKRLLSTTPLTVTDISFEVGYNSLSKFIETFRRIVGVLPSDYRENHRSDSV
jgi:AraC-like DNA-binding protein